jgi:predicted nuclease with TOPRIM domain
MRTRLRGLQDIPSIMKLEHARRSRAYTQDDEYEIFNELAQLGRERTRLIRERENWQEKIDRIDARLTDIEEAEERLRQRIDMKRASYHADQTNGKEGREVVIKY